MSMLALAGANVIGGALGMIGQNATNKANARMQREQNAWNEAQADKANKWNLAQWERENLYNSPQQQMARLEAAGLNPNLMYGQGNTGSAGSLKSEVAPSVAPSRSQNSLQYLGNSLAPAISMYQDLQNRNAQLSVQQKQAQLLDQEIAGKALDNVAKGFMNQRHKEESYYYPDVAEEKYQKLASSRWITENQQRQMLMQTKILEATMPDLIEKSRYVTRDVKQRALRGELDLEFQRELKPFGMTPQDELWQRKLTPILEKYLMQVITRGNATSLKDFNKTHDIYNRTIKK